MKKKDTTLLEARIKELMKDPEMKIRQITEIVWKEEYCFPGHVIAKIYYMIKVGALK